jgi:N-carbamoylputrescine amidase
LPELFRTQYFCQREDAAFFDLAEPVPGPTTEALRKIAQERKVVIIAPVFERRAPGVYHNSAAVIDAGGELVGLYRKMHIPDDPAYFEKYYFTPGDLGFRAFATRVGRIAVLICWDQWYPEGARLAALQGASVLFYPTAIGWHPSEKERSGVAQRDAWRTVQRAHAIANGVYVAAVNRTGLEKADSGPPSGALYRLVQGGAPARRPAERDGAQAARRAKEGPPPEGPCASKGAKSSGPQGGAGLEFWGSSFVSDPFGVVVKEALVDREETLLAEVDLGRIEDVRRNWPFLRDRRIDAYAGISSRFLDEGSWRKKE